MIRNNYINRKRILIVSARFYPENSPRAFRTTELAVELAKQGNDVTVCVPFRGFDYSDYGRSSGIKLKDLGELKFKGIELKGNNIELFLRRGLRRFLQLMIEYPDIELASKVYKHLKNERNYDLLISIAVPFPIHWGVARARKKNHRIALTWVADCGDPYMGCTTDSFKKLFYFKYIEKWFSRKCDYISIPFEALEDKFYPEFNEKIVIIPQGFRTDNIVLADYHVNKLPTFGFAGSVIPGIRDFDLFFVFLKNIDIDFKFIVYTRQPDYFKVYKKHFKEKLEVNYYIPRLQLLFELSKCDFLVNVDTIYDCNSLNTAFPSKLIDYSLTGRPILNICSNSINEKILLEFFSGKYENSRRIDNSRYKIENVAKLFLNLCKPSN